MSKPTSIQGKTANELADPYRSRPADDGGLYVLLPRDEHLLPSFPATAKRVIIAAPVAMNGARCVMCGGTGGWPGIAGPVMCKPCGGTGSSSPT